MWRLESGTWEQLLVRCLLRLLQVGLASTIHIRCIYGIFGREITKNTVIYGVYIRFCPTLATSSHSPAKRSSDYAVAWFNCSDHFFWSCIAWFNCSDNFFQFWSSMIQLLRSLLDISNCLGPDTCTTCSNTYAQWRLRAVTPALRAVTPTLRAVTPTVSDTYTTRSDSCTTYSDTYTTCSDTYVQWHLHYVQWHLRAVTPTLRAVTPALRAVTPTCRDTCTTCSDTYTTRSDTCNTCSDTYVQWIYTTRSDSCTTCSDIYTTCCDTYTTCSPPPFILMKHLLLFICTYLILTFSH